MCEGKGLEGEIGMEAGEEEEVKGLDQRRPSAEEPRSLVRFWRDRESGEHFSSRTSLDWWAPPELFGVDGSESDSTARFDRGKAVVILLAPSLEARLCVRIFEECWLTGELGGSDIRSRLGGGPGLSLAMEDALPSEARDEHDVVSDDLRSLPLKKSFILLLFSSAISTSCGSSEPPPAISPNGCDPDRAAKRPGTMAEEDSMSPLFLPVTRSLSLPKAERGLSFTRDDGLPEEHVQSDQHPVHDREDQVPAPRGVVAPAAVLQDPGEQLEAALLVPLGHRRLLHQRGGELLLRHLDDGVEVAAAMLALGSQPPRAQHVSVLRKRKHPTSAEYLQSPRSLKRVYPRSVWRQQPPGR
ncbi:hypothetical protein EYF80_016702 [Liparis tanakae]|uniref:Uncharacterized protein n=1 Tax=Liparis tanakae TaxID=230148 RepID=A0A4Z2I6W9_9TELE|nr:hypothetical protein EYF80_016702 [Liparis tanakae]